MPSTWSDRVDLETVATRVGTPFFLYDAGTLRERIAAVRTIAPGSTVQARYAMKACSAHRVLRTMNDSGIWIDAVSGNEVLRAKAAGFRMGHETPVVLLTADVFRDNALDAIRSEHILPNIGSPAMLQELAAARYKGPVGIRLNPGFGHGHVEACDTGGPSSKHGIWHEEADACRRQAEQLDMPITLLHAHVGTGPQIEEFSANMRSLGDLFADRVRHFPDVTAVNLGGGFPYSYRPGGDEFDLPAFGRMLADVQENLSRAAGRSIRLEIEPGRYFVAPAAVLVTRVTDVKQTRANEKGPGHLFAMVDAGFCDLIRPAMYGSYHHITIPGNDEAPVLTAVAGPLCESGDVFTRDADELIDPRMLPHPRIGDLLILHDAGAYGAVMSSNYNSIGRAPQVWLEDGKVFLMSRRETLDDILRTECFEPL